MQDGMYVVFVMQGSNLCLGKDDSDNCVQQSFSASSDETTWEVRSIGGSQAFFLVHYRSQKCARFNGAGNTITVAALDPNDSSFVMTVDTWGAGLVAINNSDQSQVFDVRGGSTNVGTKIDSYKWNGGTNQQWRFVPASIA
jgi:hypothetical protein